MEQTLVSFKYDNNIFVNVKAELNKAEYDGYADYREHYNHEEYPIKIVMDISGYDWMSYTPCIVYINNRDNTMTELEQTYNIYDFDVCLSEQGRKRPPTDKQYAIRDMIRAEIKKHEDDVWNTLLSFVMQTQAAFGSEDIRQQEINRLKSELEAAQKEAARTDVESLILNSVVTSLTPKIEEQIRNRIGELAGAIPTKLEVKVGDIIHQAGDSVRHKQFEWILTNIIAGNAVWLKGDAGTGKSFLCEQIAQAMGAEYHCTGSIMDEYAGLKGFIDANGVKHGTEFTRALDAMEEGKEVVMVFDEADGSTPEIMLALNNFLAGGVIECMGKAYRIKDNMHIVACGNTNGRGGDTKYVRSIIDEATLDRFCFIEVDYDKAIELYTAGGNQDLADFCHNLRESADACGIELLVTYRAINKIAKLSSIWDNKVDILQTSVIRGLEKSDMRTIINDMRNNNKARGEWFDIFEEMSE